jgi:hypothetical protein
MHPNMTTMGDRDRRLIGLPLVILQMAVSALAFMIVLDRSCDHGACDAAVAARQTADLI